MAIIRRNMNWTKIEYQLPADNDVVKVKLSNGDEVKAYFHKDKMQWLSFYYEGKLSHFQDCKTCKFLFNVVEWRYLGNPKQNKYS